MKKTIDELIDGLISEIKNNETITKKLLDKNNDNVSCNFVSRTTGVISGIHYSQYIYKRINSKISFQILREDGEFVNRGDVIAVITGPMADILRGQNLALNFVRFLSGIASITRKAKLELVNTGCELVYSSFANPIYEEAIKKAFIDGGGIVNNNKTYVITRNIRTRFDNYQEIFDRIHNLDPELEIIIEVDNVADLLEVSNILNKNKRIRVCTNKDNILEECSKYGLKHLEAMGDYDIKKIRSIASMGYKSLIIPYLTCDNNNLNIEMCFYRRIKK